MRRSARRTARCLALVALAASACTEWKIARGPVPKAAAEAAEKGRGGTIRVELNSGDVVVMTHAVVSGDSVVGSYPATGRGGVGAPVAQALGDIRRVEYERENALPWVGYGFQVALLGLVLLIVFILVAYSGGFS